MLCTVIYCLMMQPTLFKLPPSRSVIDKGKNRVFSNDVTAAILVFQTDPVVVELFLLLQEIWIDAGHQSENAP